MGSFVFYDPTGKRWNRFRRAFGIAGVLAVVLAVVLVLIILSSPQLPALGLPQVEHLANLAEVPSIIRGERTMRNIPYKFRKQSKIKYIRNGGNPVIHPKTAATPSEGQPLVFGFYVNWDPSSMVSLRLHLTHLTHLMPEWLRFQNANADLSDETDPEVVRIAQDAKLPILAMVTNFREGWQAGELHSILSKPATRADLINNIASNVAEHKFAGVNIDLEQLPRRDRDLMVQFMQELRARLPHPLLVTQSVPTDDEAYDLKRLAEINDYIVPMTYDEHYQSGSPGPVASDGWFDQQLERIAKLAPPEKVVIGTGNYGYDWIIGGRGAAEVSFGDIIAAARGNHAPITWDDDTGNPVLRYKSASGQHEVWFLDAVTALNSILDVADYGFRGVALWRMGGEDPAFWNVLAQHTWPNERFQPFTLFPLTAQASPNQYGQGEIIQVTATPQDGRRNVWKQDQDYVEQYQSYPSYYVIESSGAAAGKELCLTFDDGPSPDFTPQILDVLKEKGVKATFFVVGLNAEQWPGLIRRMYQEGHTIGNHTYTHPNIAKESLERIRFELNTTLRLIELQTGHGTKLFRPPYNADSEPRTPEEILPVLRAQSFGYVTVGERIDPRDWQPNLPADAIVSEVLAEVNNGNIILLHDAGGDRTATVTALPKLIDELRAQGYQFIPIEQLMGKTRDQIMPIPTAEEARWAEIEGGALVTKGNFKKVVGLLFLAAIYLTLFRSLTYGVLAILQKEQSRKRKFDPGFQPPVSVIIAAYNEETVIARTVDSILNNGYDDLELIIVDDGSKDGTLRVLQDGYGQNGRVRIFTQPNRGKAEALNHAINEARNNILVALDADTIFRHGTVSKLVRHFCNPMVGAVSGNARVGNRSKWITRFQSIEYIVGFNLDRRALDYLNAITVVPGAVGAWRKDLLEMLGCFHEDTLAEDTDITLSLRRLGYEIRYEEDAVAYTEAPENTRALAKQRFRWAFGTLQAAWKHRDATFHPAYGFLGFVALPSIWVFQVLLAMLSPFAEIAMVIALFAGNWRIVLLYYFGLFVLELLTALLAYWLERAQPWDLLLLFFQRIYYRQLMHYVLFKSILYAMKGRLVGWGKLERHASVKPA